MVSVRFAQSTGLIGACRERYSASLRYEWDVDDDQALGYKDAVRPQFDGPLQPGFYSQAWIPLILGIPTEHPAFFQGGRLSLEDYRPVVPDGMTPQDWELRFNGNECSCSVLAPEKLM